MPRATNAHSQQTATKSILATPVDTPIGNATAGHVTSPDLSSLFLRLPTVMKLTGLGRSTIYRLVASHSFPMPVKLAVRAVAWRRGDIEAWSQTRPTSMH